MVKIRSTCNKNYVEKFGVERPADWDYQYINYPCSDEELVEQCKDADIIHCGPVDFFRREVIEQLDNCKLIQSLGVGFDKIDLEAAKEKGIYVCNNRGVNAKPVAELAVAHMLTSLRRMPEADMKIKLHGAKGFAESYKEFTEKGQNEMGSRVVGLVGLGAIGHEAVKLLKPFGCKILYYDVVRHEEFEKEHDLTYATYEEILDQCHIISYHVPVLDSTREMIRKETIEKMKQDAIVVNVARGELVNNQDLADALNAGRIFAALDVVAPEPPAEDHPLFQLNEVGQARLSITPHIAGTTDDSFMRMSQWSYDNMQRIVDGEKPINIVNGL
ncbi:Putative 2-hydroxyacid dehydrogenase HI_1556 [Aedoeadaptatus ivorii]|uniref:2-hydroxyacid dehydrogenase HI_1556 n=1 Tax=Aedoeadaptatus ivorii TaxID=54006 RepID=A0A448UZD8_9FIRM|nr:NAD(P)-dependent oxidoreductase [Peptoniphilus ivorii]VEJ34291.1 Putative 2-hydroxyacid dehydrogenase HI_1556 [Peptoniphilus ivorii]